ncbi:unnamed protein product, partial [Larinioides sclopetarius]
EHLDCGKENGRAQFLLLWREGSRALGLITGGRLAIKDLHEKSEQLCSVRQTSQCQLWINRTPFEKMT